MALPRRLAKKSRVFNGCFLRRWKAAMGTVPPDASDESSHSIRESGQRRQPGQQHSTKPTPPAAMADYVDLAIMESCNRQLSRKLRSKRLLRKQSVFWLPVAEAHPRYSSTSSRRARQQKNALLYVEFHIRPTTRHQRRFLDGLLYNWNPTDGRQPGDKHLL